MRVRALTFVSFAGATILLIAACSDRTPTGAVNEAEFAPAAPLSPEQRARVAALVENWPEAPSYAAPFSALDPYADPARARESLFNAADPHWGLPDAMGRDLVESYCAACHSLQLVMQQRMNTMAWDQTIARMSAERGMPQLRDDVRRGILDYLAAHFGV